MTTTERLITADELLRRPKDGFRYALVAGELRRMSPASYQHGRLAMNIASPLDQYVRQRRLGIVLAAETGFLVANDPDTVLAPDAAFVRRERVEAVGDSAGYWPGAPDLAVEIVSRHDLYTEIDEKVSAWLAAGTRMVIVVNPCQHHATVYRSLHDIAIFTEDDVLDGGDVVPGWCMPVRELFV
jgi:Uma2 family endonuclease